MKNRTLIRQLPVVCFVSLMIVVITLSRAAGAQRGNVVINEIGWMGTVGGGRTDEWIELYNNTSSPVDLDNWSIEDESYGSSNQYIKGIKGTIPAKGYFLIENDEDCIKDIPADFIFPEMDLKDGGEKLTLKDSDRNVIDVAGRIRKDWYAGDRKKPKYSMERTIPYDSGREPNNWHTNNGIIVNGIDKKGNTINGTPKSVNSFVPVINKEEIDIRILNPMVPPLMVDFSVPAGALVSVRIYDSSRLVRTLINRAGGLTDREPLKEGLQGSCIWDEKDAYGERVAPGEYRALLEVLIEGAGRKEFKFSKPIKIKYIPFK